MRLDKVVCKTSVTFFRTFFLSHPSILALRWQNSKRATHPATTPDHITYIYLFVLPTPIKFIVERTASIPLAHPSSLCGSNTPPTLSHRHPGPIARQPLSQTLERNIQT